MAAQADAASPVAIVTGAGTGIGREVASMLGARGWRLVLAGRRREPLGALASEIGHGRALVQPTDLADSAQVEALVRAAVDRFGRIDALVNNAGGSAQMNIEETNLEVIRAVFEVNAIAPAYAIHLSWPYFARQKRGCIVNVSSMATSDPFAGFFAYAAAKAGVNLMARSCAKEGEPIGVRAFAVAPAAVETPLLRSLFDRDTVPTDACLTPAQVAQVIIDCIEGRRDRDNGRTVFLQREGDRVRESVA